MFCIQVQPKTLLIELNSIGKDIKKALRKRTMSIDWFTVKYSNILTWLKIKKNRSKVGSVSSKIELIEAKNRLWKDLYEDLVRDPSLRSG